MKIGPFEITLRKKAEKKSHDDFWTRDDLINNGTLPRSWYQYGRDIKHGLDSNVIMSPVSWIMRTFTEADPVVEARRNDRWRLVEGHKLTAILNQPNAFYDGDALFKSLVISYCLDGNGYVIKRRNTIGEVLELWYAPHWMIEPQSPDDGSRFISHYEYRPRRLEIQRLLPRDVIHLRFGLDPRNPRKGFSPLQSLMREIFTDEEASNFAAAVLRNQGFPGVVISPKEGMSQTREEAGALKTRFQQHFTGDRRGEPFVATRPTDIATFGFNAQQIQLTGLRDVSEERVCLHPDTEIVTKRGVVPITEVVIGDEVVTHRGRWRRVLGSSKTPAHEPLLEIRADGFEPLTATVSHRVLAATYKPRRDYNLEFLGADWVAAGSLEVRNPRSRQSGHAMTIPVLHDELEGIEHLGLRGHVEGDRFNLRESGGVLTHPSPRVQAIAARPALDAAFGRLLGFYLAEGSVGGNRVYWYFHEDEKDYQEAVQSDLAKVFGLRSSIKRHRENHVAAVVVQSAGLARLFDLGLQPDRRLPAWAWGGAEEFRHAMLSSWVSGDGEVRADGAVNVTTRSRDLAWQMRLVAISCGFAASIRTYARKRPCNIGGRTVAHGGPVYIVGWSSPKALRQRWYRIENEQLYTAAVRSISDSTYRGPVFNLKVEEDESYLTTGGMVHNCAMLGLPAAVVGFGAGLQQVKVGATMRELVRLARVNVINPMARSFGKALTTQLLVDFVAQLRRFRVRFDMSDVSVFQEDETEREERIIARVDGGVMQVADAQDALGLEVDETQRVYLRDSNKIAVPAGRDPLEFVGDPGTNGNGTPGRLADAIADTE